MLIPKGWTLRYPLLVAVAMVGLNAAGQQPEGDRGPADEVGPQVDSEGISVTGPQEVAGTFGDPLRTLLLLPGVTHLASGVAQPVIRGFQPATSQLRIDGVRVPLRFHLLAGPSTVNPDFLGEVTLRSGATPVAYGRSLGAVIDARTYEGPDQLTAGLDLLNVSAAWQQTLEDTGTRFLVSGRVGYSALAGGAIASALSSSTSLSAQMYDYQAKVSQKIASGELRLLALGASTGGGMEGANRGDTIAPYDAFHRIDLRYAQPLAGGEVSVAGTWGVERMGIDVGGGNVFGLGLRDTTFAGRAHWTAAVLPALVLEVGADVERRDPQTVQRSQILAPEVPGTETPDPLITTVRQALGPALLGGAYLRGAYTLELDASRLVIEPSFRFDTYAIGELEPMLTYEPRLAVQYLRGASTFGISGGLYHQLGTTLVDFTAAEFARAPMGLQEVLKLDASVSHTVSPALRGRVAVFVNPIQRAIELSLFDPHFQQQLSWSPEVTADLLSDRVESGLSAGLEAFLYAQPLPGLSGWISYTFTRSLRNTTFQRHDALGQPTGAPVTQLLASPLEREHVVDVVGQYQLAGGWSLGANVHFNTGFPEAGNVASFTRTEGTNAEGHPDWLPVDRDQVGRMPLYWRVDARVAKTWDMKDWSLQAYLDILNLSVNQEVLRVNYNRQEDPLTGAISLERGAMRYPVILPMLGIRANL